MAALVQGWLQVLGPVTSGVLGAMLRLDPAMIFAAMLAGEMQGLVMRGVFEMPAPDAADGDTAIEWCDRRLLQRIHRLTLSTLRKGVEAVPPAVYLRWVLRWQHLAPGTQLAGEEGVLEAISQMEGFEAPAVEWERTLLPARVASYDPRWLDALCLSGAVGWGRISPHPAWSAGEGVAPRRVIPTNAAPITFYLRDTADWLPVALAEQCVDERNLLRALSADGLKVREMLKDRGASFAADLQRVLGFTKQQVQHALWELATAGLAAADGFDQLRALMDPRRKSATAEAAPTSVRRRASARMTAGRWSLLCADAAELTPDDPIAKARLRETALEASARQLLLRYGVVFRDLLTRESNAPKWRDLAHMLRRLEGRGEVRRGRFGSGGGGEQLALAGAVDSLRAGRKLEQRVPISVAGADPMNLVGIVVPGERVAASPGRSVVFVNGAVAGAAVAADAEVAVVMPVVESAVEQVRLL